MSTPGEARARTVMEGLERRVLVGPAPVAAVLAHGRQRRLRRRLALMGTAAVLVAGVALGASLGLGGDDRVVTPSKNLLDRPWWSEGTLHLPGGDVAMPGVEQIVEVPGGVVVTDGSGDVLLVDESGRTRALGDRERFLPGQAGAVLYDAQAGGRLAWQDVTVEGDQVIVVWDLEFQRQLAIHQVDHPWTSPVMMRAFEGGVVYWDQPHGGDRAWDWSTDTVEKLGTGATYVLDVAGRTEVTLDHTGESVVVRRDWGEVYRLNHDDIVDLAPGGAWLFGLGLRTAGSPRDGMTLEVHETVNGTERATGLPEDAQVRNYAPLSDGVFLAVVARDPSGPVDIMTCDLESATCTTVVEDAAADGRVVLPGGQLSIPEEWTS